MQRIISAGIAATREKSESLVQENLLVAAGDTNVDVVGELFSHTKTGRFFTSNALIPQKTLSFESLFEFANNIESYWYPY